MEDSYFVALGLRECGETIHAAVTDSITGELVDHYELIGGGGGEGLFRFDWGAAESFEGVVHDALSHYRL